MYQKSCLRQNVEIKNNIFDKQLIIHNRTRELTQKYMFIFLLGEFCSNILCGCFLIIKLELKCGAKPSRGKRTKVEILEWCPKALLPFFPLFMFFSLNRPYFPLHYFNIHHFNVAGF